MSLDQIEYAASLNPVVDKSLSQLSDEDYCTEWLHGCFMALLGGCAWVLQTRMDIAIYVASLQRHSKKPKAVHMRRLNRLIKYLQRTPKAITHHKLKPPIFLISIADSAFQSQKNGDPLVMRGFMLALAEMIFKDGKVFLRVQPFE